MNSCEQFRAKRNQGPLNGGVSNGGVSRSGLVLPFLQNFVLFCPFLSFFVVFCPFWDFPDFSRIFPNCSGMVRGFSRFVLFLFLGLLRAPTRNSPEGAATQSGPFPKKVGNPGLASLKSRVLRFAPCSSQTIAESD